MYKIYFRKNGQQQEIPRPKDLKENFIEKVLQEFNFPFDIEIALCMLGNLGNELFLDPRLETKLQNEDKDRLNQTVVGKTFKEVNLCYICISNEKTLFWKSILHELHHFQDPYECSEDDYITPTEEGNYVEPKGYVTNLIGTHLNDFFAEYFAIKRLIDLKYDRSVKGINLILIIDINLCYIKKNEKYVKEQIQETTNKELSDFEKKLSIIYSLHHNIIKQVFYYLASYRAFQEKRFNNNLYEERWSQFVSKEVNPTMAKLLIEIKKKIMNMNLNLIEHTSELRDELNEIFFEFYNTDIDDYLTELFEQRPKYSPFFILQDLTRKINLGWVTQMHNLARTINLGWIEQIKTISKPLIEPLSQISNLAKMLNEIVPKTVLQFYDDEKDEVEDVE